MSEQLLPILHKLRGWSCVYYIEIPTNKKFETESVLQNLSYEICIGERCDMFIQIFLFSIVIISLFVVVFPLKLVLLIATQPHLNM